MSNWNRAKQGTGNTEKGVEKRKARNLPIALGAVCLVIVGAGVWWMLSPSGETRQSTASTKKGLIKEATPAAAPKAKEEPVSGGRKRNTREFWKEDNTNGFNAAMQLKWKHYHVPPAIFTNTLSRTQPPEKYEIFEHWSENKVASYLTMEPGQGLVGTPVFDDTLESDFLKSCEEPIIVTKDDSEYNAALKRQMIETKIEIRQRMADGEKLGDILLETHKEMQKLAAVKSEIEQLVHESLKEAKSEADIDDLMTAANKMLEDRGVAPISLNPVIKRNLMRHIINEGE